MTTSCSGLIRSLVLDILTFLQLGLTKHDPTVSAWVEKS